MEENIKGFRLPAEVSHGQHCSLELLAASIDLGTIIAPDASAFVQGVKEHILSFLDPFVQRGGEHAWVARTLECLRCHLVAYRDLYAAEAVPLLIAGIDADAEAWQMRTRGELIATMTTSSTADMVVDCLGGLPSLLAPHHAEGSVAVIQALASGLEQLPDGEGLLAVLSGLLCSQVQSLIDSDSDMPSLESAILVMYQALARGSGPLALPLAVSGQVSSLLIQIGNHGHHVAFLHSNTPEALAYYLSLVGRYAQNDPSLAAHLGQLLAAGGLDAVLQSDVLPLLAARFPHGSYHTLVRRFVDSTGESLPCIKRQLFEGLLGLGDDLLQVASSAPPPDLRTELLCRAR